MPDDISADPSLAAIYDDLDGARDVESWVELLEVALPLVSFRWAFRFIESDELLTSDSTLRFRDRAEIDTSLGQCDFDVVEVLDALDRPGAESVFVASSHRALR